MQSAAPRGAATCKGIPNLCPPTVNAAPSNAATAYSSVRGVLHSPSFQCLSRFLLTILSSFGESTQCRGWTKSSTLDVYLPIDTLERSPAVNA